MLGRAAYHTPWILSEVDQLFFGEAARNMNRAEIVERMKPYVAAELRKAPGLARLTRHMLGLFHGEPGGRVWRRVISEEAHRRNAGIEVLDRALAAVTEQSFRMMAAE
jgi:tRNA-dihydrouridine synthase A